MLVLRGKLLILRGNNVLNINPPFLNSKYAFLFPFSIFQLGIIYNIRDILQIGRFSSSGDNFVSDSGECLFIGRTDFHPKKRNSDEHFSLYLRALQLSFSDGD